MATLSISLSNRDKQFFIHEYRRYLKKALENNEPVYSMSRFFMDIFAYWYDNFDENNKKKEEL